MSSKGNTKLYLMIGLFVVGYALGYWQGTGQVPLLPGSILNSTLGAVGGMIPL